MKQYLSDGAYFEDDGYQVRLSTMRGNTEHEVYLDPSGLEVFFKRLERSRSLKITVERAPNEETQINEEA